LRGQVDISMSFGNASAQLWCTCTWGVSYAGLPQRATYMLL